MKVRELKAKLGEFDDEMEVQFIHGGNQTFASSVIRLVKMFFAPDKGGSRGEPDDNVSYEKDEEFYEEVVVLDLDW